MALLTWYLFAAVCLTAILTLPLALYRKRFLPAALTLIGALLTFGLVSLVTGLAEHSWTITNPSALLAAAIGISGLSLFTLGLTKVLYR